MHGFAVVALVKFHDWNQDMLVVASVRATGPWVLGHAVDVPPDFPALPNDCSLVYCPL